MTAIKQYYLDLPRSQRTAFREKIMHTCGIHLRSFYRYLHREPPKLVQEVITREVNLNTNLWTEVRHGS